MAFLPLHLEQSCLSCVESAFSSPGRAAPSVAAGQPPDIGNNRGNPIKAAQPPLRAAPAALSIPGRAPPSPGWVQCPMGTPLRHRGAGWMLDCCSPIH